jgi:hypothetical protein
VESGLSARFHLFFFLIHRLFHDCRDSRFVDISNWKNAIFFAQVALGTKKQTHYKPASADF